MTPPFSDFFLFCIIFFLFILKLLVFVFIRFWFDLKKHATKHIHRYAIEKTFYCSY